MLPTWGFENGLETSTGCKSIGQTTVRGCLQGSYHPCTERSALVTPLYLGPKQALNSLVSRYLKDHFLPYYLAYQLRSSSQAPVPTFRCEASDD